MRVGNQTILGRLAQSTRTTRPWLHVSTSPWWTSALVAAGARLATEPSRPAVSAQHQGPTPEAQSEISRNVVVIHGRDRQSTTALFEFLRSIGLTPLDWESIAVDTSGLSPALGPVLATARAQAAVVLLTPDDVAALHPDLRGSNETIDELRPTGQPRPEVLVQLGMALALYNERAIVLEVGQLRQAADIGGSNTVRLDGSPQAITKLVARLRQAGLPIGDVNSGQDQLRDLDAYHRQM